MTQIIYSRIRVSRADAEGRVVKNPMHFTKPVEGATKVFIDGDYPQITAAYAEAKVPVASIDDLKPLPGNAKLRDEPAATDKSPQAKA